MKPHMVLPILLLLAGCNSNSAEELLPQTPDPGAFEGYWHQGKAELTRYALRQARYGEMHEGDAVLIFVTEPFLKDKQVKRDYGDGAADTVLKLNATRKFHTGIYPYSLMTSVFTTADFETPQTPKVSFSAQEWCGHVYMQLNRTKKGYRAVTHSYFQREGDAEEILPDAALEDGLWPTIRIAPRKLPTGKLNMVPALHFLRLAHVETKAYPVKASLEGADDETFGKALLRYRLQYPDLVRTVDIFFEKDAPHRIMGWREEAFSGWGESRQKLTTEATRTHELLSDYWGKNHNADRALRKQLGLAE